MTGLWQAEPTMILGAVSAGVALLLAFGVNVTKEQMGAIMAFVSAILALINRSQVTSPATLQNMTPKTLADAQDTAQPVKDVVKKLPVVLLALVLAGLSYGCAAPVTVVTPQGQAAYKADQVVVRVNELMNAAIAAEKAGALATKDARTIIAFCVSADNTLAATPAGWPATLTVAWKETKAALPPITNPAILAAMSAVDVVLAAQ